MANENLQNALFDAGLSAEQLAQVIRVDPKSAQRWLAGNTIPYPRHRKAISRALNLSEQELWPEQTPASGPDSDPDSDPMMMVGGCDVVGSWAYAADDTVPDLVELITDSDGPIDFLDSSFGIKLTAEVAKALAAQTATGREIRMLSDLPSEHHAVLIGQPHAEIRLRDIWVEFWFLRAGERMLFAINFQNDVTVFSPPVLELDGSIQGGLFDRAINKFDELWQNAQEDDDDTLLDSRERLDQALAYLKTLQAGPADQQQPDNDSHPGATASPYDPTQTPSSSVPADESLRPQRRRWPRQPQ